MNKERYYDKMALRVSEKVKLNNPHFNSQGVIDSWNDMMIWNYIKHRNTMDIPIDHVEVYNRVEKILYENYKKLDGL